MVEFVINKCASPATGYTPFFLNYGFEPVTPMAMLRDTQMTAMEGVNVFAKRMERTFQHAMQEVRQAQQRQKQQRIKRGKNKDFAVGTRCF